MDATTETGIDRFGTDYEAMKAHCLSFKRGERVLTYDYETESWDDHNVVVAVDEHAVTTNWVNFPRDAGYHRWPAGQIRHI